MTYTTLLASLILITLPLSANAKDVKGLNRAKLCEQGYKVGCPDELGNMVQGDGQHKDDPAKAQTEYGDSVDYGTKAHPKTVSADDEGDAGEDGKGEEY